MCPKQQHERWHVRVLILLCVCVLNRCVLILLCVCVLNRCVLQLRMCVCVCPEQVLQKQQRGAHRRGVSSSTYICHTSALIQYYD